MRTNRFIALFRSFLSLVGASLIAVGPVNSRGNEIEGVAGLATSEGVSTPIGDPAVADLDFIFDEFSTYFEEGGEVLSQSDALSGRVDPPVVASNAGSKRVGPQVGSSFEADSEDGKTDTADFVGDAYGEGGVANDESVWVRTYADTMVQRHEYPSHSAGRGNQLRPGYTSFENGYIPKFEDDLELVDETPAGRDYAQAEGYSRLPDSWSLPPGGAAARPGGYPQNGAPTYSLYPGEEGTVYRGASTYGSSIYDSGSYYDPNGPYSYRLGDNDRTVSDRLLYEDANFTFQGDIPLITRKFNPDEAHFKLGGLYFQAISTEVGVLFSDYDGPNVFRTGDEDGFLSFVGFRFRAAGRISPSFYVTTDVNLIYLIGANELAVRAGTAGSPFLSLDYHTECGPWDIHVFDYAGTAFPYQFGRDGLERAGRYQFGFAGFEGGTNQYSFSPVFYNRFGINAQRLIQEDWRLTLTALQSDYWRTDSDIDDSHTSVQTVGARLGYEGMEVPFSPWTQYRASSNDYFDSATHMVTAGGHGRITERLSADAMVGTLWSTGRVADTNHWLWRIGLRHELSPVTTQGIRIGSGYFESDFSDESLVSEYLHYYLNHRINEDTTFSAFAQWSSDEFLTGRLVGGEYDREIYGVRLTSQLSQDLSGSLGYLFEQRKRSTDGMEDERHIFSANLNALLDRRTTAYLRYRFENAELFDESLYTAGVRRYF